MNKVQNSNTDLCICLNKEDCKLAEEEKIIEIIDGNLECPECGEPLKPHPSQISASGGHRNRPLIIMIVLILILFLFGLVFFLKR